MTGRERAVSTHEVAPLQGTWSVLASAAGDVCTPEALARLPAMRWHDGVSPGTVAHALRSIGRWSIDTACERLDAQDWWFRLRFDVAVAPPQARRRLRFAGLAGVAQVWLNGSLVLSSQNMHLCHTLDDPGLREGANELLLRFMALDGWLATRRPRPRWRAPMVEHQQLRWTRNALLGRTPGWSPPAPAIGPWREIELVDAQGLDVSELRWSSRVAADHGEVRLSARLTPLAAGATVRSARLELAHGGARWHAELVDHGATHEATLRVADPQRWWPHTHGSPALYEVRLVVQLQGRPEPVTVALGRTGFRDLAVRTDNGDFAVHVNGERVFCRGACWTPLDVVSLRSSPAQCRAALEQVRRAGMNMLRVSGAMVYEEDHFYDLCDELGILVWQDFMFANMDYPASDPDFAETVREEVRQHARRWQARACLAVLCGNSEAEQQAAMWGSARETWAQPLFDRDVAQWVRPWCPHVQYWPSSAHGGAFPHQNDVGTTSYYGVGAYLRPLEDARRSRVRFATECLALAHVPADSTLARMPGGSAVRVHHAAWKARSPRDLGAGWDFDDVRDHYLQRLYGVDPVALRSVDHARYLAMSRAVSAEVVYASLSEWRRRDSDCRGALIWTLRDLWAGAGWGLLDDQGVPKAAFHGACRALSPTAVFLSDEGTNGLALHLVHEPAHAVQAWIDIAVFRDDGLALHRASRLQAVAARSALTLPLAEFFDHFIDLSRAYRFGPAEHALVHARLRDESGRVLTQAFYEPADKGTHRERDIGLSATAARAADGSVAVRLHTVGHARSVHFEVPGHVADEEYFHIAPGDEHTVTLRPMRPSNGGSLSGQVRALNAWTAASVRLDT